MNFLGLSLVRRAVRDGNHAVSVTLAGVAASFHLYGRSVPASMSSRPWKEKLCGRVPFEFRAITAEATLVFLRHSKTRGIIRAR